MKYRLRILAVVIPLVFALDQFTKWLVLEHIPLGDSIPILPGLFDLVHTRNRGAAFGFMAGVSDSVRVPFFFATSLIALGLISLYFLRMKDPRKSVYISLSLILGGALGNIWDRIRLGEVVDFLSFHWYEKALRGSFLGFHYYLKLEWPAFNVADSAISVAVIWLMILMLLHPHPQEYQEAKK